ncbi:methionine aminopeptidase [Cystoisospora suis]|uniref:Methionine aminopeptidase n=1 Tax=Cystoisospora suis TaxID=483139 RepID=A0A2C6L770_9APIC|nr:methionine aminopeptidase [Cystoisospora suis]
MVDRVFLNGGHLDVTCMSSCTLTVRCAAKCVCLQTALQSRGTPDAGREGHSRPRAFILYEVGALRPTSDWFGYPPRRTISRNFLRCRSVGSSPGRMEVRHTFRVQEKRYPALSETPESGQHRSPHAFPEALCVDKTLARRRALRPSILVKKAGTRDIAETVQDGNQFNTCTRRTEREEYRDERGADALTPKGFLGKRRPMRSFPAFAADRCASLLQQQGSFSPPERKPNGKLVSRRHLLTLFATLWTASGLITRAATAPCSRSNRGSKLSFQLSPSPPSGFASLRPRLSSGIKPSRPESHFTALLSPLLFPTLSFSQGICRPPLQTVRRGGSQLRSPRENNACQSILPSCSIQRDHGRASSSGMSQSSTPALFGQGTPAAWRKQSSYPPPAFVEGCKLRRCMESHTLPRTPSLGRGSCKAARHRPASTPARALPSTALRFFSTFPSVPSFMKLFPSPGTSFFSGSSCSRPTSAVPSCASSEHICTALPRVVKGHVSPTRKVPAHIPRPPYGIADPKLADAKRAAIENEELRLRRACEGEMRQRLEPFLPVTEKEMEWVKPAKEIEGVRRACEVAAEVLQIAVDYVQDSTGDPGGPLLTTEAIDQVVHEATIARGAYPSPLLYSDFPKSVCTSTNEIICHGIPDDNPLQRGSICSIDVSCFVDGFHGDCARTVAIGGEDSLTPALKRLLSTAQEAVIEGVRACKPGRRLSVIGETIENYLRKEGYRTIPYFCGHGIGRNFHEEPFILHTPNSMPGRMLPGMCFTIEPVVCSGGTDFFIWPDKWTVQATDGSP